MAHSRAKSKPSPRLQRKTAAVAATPAAVEADLDDELDGDLDAAVADGADDETEDSADGAGLESFLTEVEDDAPATSTKSKAPASLDHLSTYFRDLGEHELLDPRQEQELAIGIEQGEILAWQRLLSYPPALEFVLEAIETHIDDVGKPVAAVRRAAAKARRERNRTTKAALERAAASAAEPIRAGDLDRVALDGLVGELTRLRDLGTTQTLGRAKLTASHTSKAFRDFVHGVELAASAGSQLRDEFVRANLRLVVTMARRYDRGGMPLPDLIQEGNLGLMHAVARFDHRRGLRFSTYACWWIRHAIGRALADKSRAVRIPVHMLEAQQQLHKVEQRLVASLGRAPTPQELAQAARVPMAKLEQMHRYLMGQPMSLDRPIHADDDRAFGELLADPDTEDASPADAMTNRALTDQVTKLLGDLSPIEADVLRQRFGLRDDEERTFREIGDQYHLSRERIRQIQNSALGKLRRALESQL